MRPSLQINMVVLFHDFIFPNFFKILPGPLAYTVCHPSLQITLPQNSRLRFIYGNLGNIAFPYLLLVGMHIFSLC